MIGDRPKFMDSPYFVDDPGNWHLKDGAPEAVVIEFREYMEETAETEKPPDNTAIEL